MPNYAAAFPSEEELRSILAKCQNPSQFAVSVARRLFTREELAASNCKGVKEKSRLDEGRLLFVRKAVGRCFELPPLLEGEVWRQCTQAIDTRCRHERRPKYRNMTNFSTDF